MAKGCIINRGTQLNLETSGEPTKTLEGKTSLMCSHYSAVCPCSKKDDGVLSRTQHGGDGAHRSPQPMGIQQPEPMFSSGIPTREQIQARWSTAEGDSPSWLGV